MLSKFFIDRPIFATVVSLVIITVGVVSLLGLPIAQYPNLAPPTISVTAVYPGADAQVVADTVAAPIEQEVNGVEGMIYMSSVSAGDGSYTLTITFEPAVDLDIATVQVQNRVSAAEPRLPEDVRRFGIKTQKKMPDFAQMVSVVGAEDAPYDDVFLSNFATLQLRDQLKRIPGVGDARVFGAAEYAMRLWLDPAKLDARDVTADEVVAAIREQNVQVAAGKVGEMPAPAGTAFQYAISTKGRLVEAEEFAQIVVRTDKDGSMLRLGDVARIELAAQNYAMQSRLNGRPAANLAIYQLPGANLIDISNAVSELIEAGRAGYPDGLDVSVTFDAADVVRASIKEIVITLLIAAALVILTVLIFRQDVRATLVPTVTIPVSLVGTFAVLAMLGFSLNTLTLFGVVLAIGIVVDDAIVVVENVARNIDELGLAPREATVKAMEEVSGPVVATTLVLLAVFVPTAFMEGMVGEMFRQFGLTIAASTFFSSINALTMSPALCALLMRPSKGKKNLLFRGFDAAINWSTRGYKGMVRRAVRFAAVSFVLFLAAVGGGGYLFTKLPAAFVPPEDMGYAIGIVQLPDAASMERTGEVADQVDAILAETEGVKSSIAMPGFSMIDGAINPNVCSYIIVFEHWDERTTDEDSLRGILTSFNTRAAAIEEARVFAFPVPSIPGVGFAGGFDLQLQDRAGLGVAALQEASDAVLAAAAADGRVERLSSGLRSSVPSLWIDVDREKVKKMGLSLQSVFGALQVYLGSAYANDFNAFNRTYQVRVQAEAAARASPDDILDLRVRGPQGSVPLRAIARIEERFVPSTLNRYNLYPAASIKGQAVAGQSSGQALDLMEQVSEDNLAGGFGYEWTGLSYQEREVAGGMAAIFMLSIFLVFLVLAAQYESWLLPVAIVASVPLGLLGAAGGSLATGLGNNVYTQIGVVLLIGLVAKNAILIVEFAKEKRDEGLGIVEAAVEASALRFRPILMTAFSFILGTLPLLTATGAGAVSRIALGSAVFAGLTLATAMGVFFTPVLYRMIQGLSELRATKRPDADAATEPPRASS